MSNEPVDADPNAEPPSGSRAIHAAVALAIILVGVVLLALVHPASPIVNVGAASTEITGNPANSVTKTPAIPPFYDVANPAPAKPGTLVKSEPVPGGPTGTTSTRFIYHSTDNNNKDQVVSGLYVKPTTQPPSGGFPLVTLAHGTTGTNRHCGISQTPFEPNMPGYYTFNSQILPLVQQGYAVVATDYQGMGAPGTPSYLVGQIEGRNTLDAVRTVHAWQPDVNKEKTVIWGHSQGGHSSAFAAELASSYAPELAIQGSVVLAPGLLPSLPLAVEGLLASTEPSGQTGFVMEIAAAWSAAYPDQMAPETILTPAGVAKLPIVNEVCGSQVFDQFMSGPMSDFVKSPVPAVFYSLATENTPGSEKINMPIFMAQGMKDTTIIPQLTLAFNKQLCQMGNTVDFHIYPDDTHSGVVVNSRDLAQSWIKDRFEGNPAPNNCSNQ